MEKLERIAHEYLQLLWFREIFNDVAGAVVVCLLVGGVVMFFKKIMD